MARRQVRVVGHQHVGVHRAVVLESGLAEFLLVLQVIAFTCKTGPAIDAALQQMLRHTWQVEAGLAAHRDAPMGASDSWIVRSPCVAQRPGALRK